MPLVINGWTILYYPPLFGRRFVELRAEARRLKRLLPEKEYREHPVVKLAASIHRLVTRVVPLNPDAQEFRLSGDLSAYRRARGNGPPPRYRLFWIFSSQAMAIIFLYFNDETTLRKAGSKTDPYDRIAADPERFIPNSAKPKPKRVYAWTPMISLDVVWSRKERPHDAADGTLRHPDRRCPLLL